MARSLFQLVKIKAEIGKTMRMVLCFHPLFTVASLIFRINNLLDYLSTEGPNNLVDRIVKMMSYLRESLKGYWQSTTMIAVRDAIAAKMKTPSEALKKQLHKEAAKGYPKVMLIGKLALYSAIFLLQDTELISTHDKKILMSLLTGVCLGLLMASEGVCNRIRVLRRMAGWKVNSTSNFTCFILALVFEKLYENSWRSLSAGFCIAVYFLSLLIIVRPQIDFGFFGLIMGVIGSITYNCYGFKSPTWGIACICFVLISFKSWLDKYWLDLEEDASLPSTTYMGTAAMWLSLPFSALSFATVLCRSRVGDGLGEPDLKDLSLVFVIAFVSVVIIFNLLGRVCKRAALQILAKDHLPVSTTVKLNTRQAFWWTKVFLLLDFLFFLLSMTGHVTREKIFVGGLAFVAFTNAYH